MTTIKKPVPASSPDIPEERLNLLRETFPEAFSEGRIDFDRLRAAQGDLVNDLPERYTFTWAGKRDAIRLLQTPTRATLVPCPDESVDLIHRRTSSSKATT
jgi:adenine-specific DNA-methyltransferase